MLKTMITSISIMVGLSACYVPVARNGQVSEYEALTSAGKKVSQRTYALSQAQVIDRLKAINKDFPPSVGQLDSQPKISTDALGNVSIFIEKFSLKDSKDVRCDSSGIGRHPSLDNGTLLISIRPNGTKITVSVESRFSDVIDHIHTIESSNVVGVVHNSVGVPIPPGPSHNIARSLAALSNIDKPTVTTGAREDIAIVDTCISMGNLEQALLDYIQPVDTENVQDALILNDTFIWSISADMGEQGAQQMRKTALGALATDSKRKEIAEWARAVAPGEISYYDLCRANDMAVILARGELMPKDEQTAFRLFNYVAKSTEYVDGHASVPETAQFNLGLMYAKGWGVAKDEGKAYDLFKKIVDNSNQGQKILPVITAAARVNAGYYLTKGLPNTVQKDDKAAAILFGIAAVDNEKEQTKNFSALHNLGYMFSKGIAVKQNEPAAFYCYMRAGQNGDLNSQRSAEIIRSKYEATHKDNSYIDKIERNGSTQLVVKNYVLTPLNGSYPGDVRIE